MFNRPLSAFSWPFRCGFRKFLLKDPRHAVRVHAARVGHLGAARAFAKRGAYGACLVALGAALLDDHGAAVLDELELPTARGRPRALALLGRAWLEEGC